ncbi:hypothetical protein OHB01_29710 [Microbispora hainanensis]|nr:hypothetical protein [Microbispora hainanensis]
MHAGGIYQRPGLPSRACRAAEQQVSRLEQRSGAIVEVGGPVRGQRFAGQRRQVDLHRAVEHPGVGRHPVTLLDDQHITRHEPDGVDHLKPAVPDDLGLGRQVAGQCLNGVLGLLLLREGQERVQDDHRDDRDG